MLDASSNYYEADTKEMMSQTKFFSDYSRWKEDQNRYETWDEAVRRVMDMHRAYYADVMTPKLAKKIDRAEELYLKKRILGAQRALQFGGEQILKNPMRMYNCTSSYADRPEFFGEMFDLLLCGAGVGFSVQKHHVAKMPDIQERKKQAKVFVPEDSIEGWAQSLDILMSSYFVGGGKHPEYEGRKVFIDLSQIRPKGAYISGGFKAPGPEPLRRALDKVEYLLQGLVLKGVTRLEPIHVYDICMYASDAVLSGGVRRSASICFFSPDDDAMMNAKTGDWFPQNPQRARSNNSALLVRDQATKEQFLELFERTKQFGEPGFYFTTSTEHISNPCVEIGMMPNLDGISGWQGCNLTEINGAACHTREEFLEACEAASILGTLQAGYTNFKFVSDITKKIFEREALLGVSVTGWMNNASLLFDPKVQKQGALLCVETNKEVAKMIGINPAARVCCTKPSGNASVLLKTSFGIHGEHSPMYLRHIQLNKELEVAQLLAKTNPYMVEDSLYSENGSDYTFAFPVVAPAESSFRREMMGIEFLKRVLLTQQNWVEYGTNHKAAADPNIRHNVSNTVTVPTGKWDEVADFIYDHKDSFSGISLLADTGDKAYAQAPNAEVLTEEQIVEKYGRAALFASGLIVDTFKGFDNLWQAVAVAKNIINKTKKQEAITGGELSDLRAEWIRRFEKFAENYFDGDLTKTEHCLKDVYYLHRWTKIQQNLKEVDFVAQLGKKEYTDISTMAAIACQGGACELIF